MGLNTTKKPLDDVRVRQAINYAINKDTVVAGDRRDRRSPTRATSIQPPTIAGRVDYDPYPTDPAKAASKLLAEAGLGGRLQPHPGHPPGGPPDAAMAVAIQEALKPLKIDVKINNIDTSTFYEVIGTPRSSTTRPSPAGARTGRPARPSCRRCSTAATSPTRATRTSPRSTTRRSTSGSTRSRAMTDVNAANAAYGELDKQIMELAPIVPLVYEKNVIDRRRQHRRRVPERRVLRRHRPGLPRAQRAGQVGARHDHRRTLARCEGRPRAGTPGAPATSGRRVAGALLHDWAAVLSTGFLALVVLMAVCAPLITALTGHGPNDFDAAAIDTDLGGLPRRLARRRSAPSTCSASSRRTAATSWPASCTAPACRS